MTTETGMQPPSLPKGANEAFCSSCGNPINLKANVCPNCGVQRRKGADKTALALLAFFLGGFGAHKFYVGKYGQGIFYILFCILKSVNSNAATRGKIHNFEKAQSR